MPHSALVRDRGPSGAAAAETPFKQVGNLALHNPNNYCYQNTFVLTWMWTMLHSHAAQGHRRLKEDIVGQGYTFMQQLLQRQPRRLHHAMAWSTYIQSWPRQQAQHDVAEFSTHALKLLNPPCMQGHWQSRLQDPVLRIFDQGVLTAPLVLPVPDPATCIQDCVNEWHS